MLCTKSTATLMPERSLQKQLERFVADLDILANLVIGQFILSN